jgi:hypothetical protein
MWLNIQSVMTGAKKYQHLGDVSCGQPILMSKFYIDLKIDMILLPSDLQRIHKEAMGQISFGT